jgi:hypothetical protein
MVHMNKDLHDAGNERALSDNTVMGVPVVAC